MLKTFPKLLKKILPRLVFPPILFFVFFYKLLRQIRSDRNILYVSVCGLTAATFVILSLKNCWLVSAIHKSHRKIESKPTWCIPSVYAFNASMHSMRLCIQCVYALYASVHSMHLCILCVYAFYASMHSMRLCIVCVYAFYSFMHSIRFLL